MEILKNDKDELIGIELPSGKIIMVQEIILLLNKNEITWSSSDYCISYALSSVFNKLIESFNYLIDTHKAINIRNAITQTIDAWLLLIDRVNFIDERKVMLVPPELFTNYCIDRGSEYRFYNIKRYAGVYNTIRQDYPISFYTARYGKLVYRPKQHQRKKKGRIRK